MPTRTPLADLDHHLARYRAAVDAISQNLLELEQLPAAALLGGAFTGVTAERAPQAKAALARLWEELTLLRGVVESAEKLREGWRVDDDEHAQLEALLLGPSVALPAATVPLAERTVATPAELQGSISPEQLLSLMSSEFDEAKATVLALDAAWTALLPAIEAARAELERGQRQRDEHHLGTLTELAELASTIDRLASISSSDPLAAGPDPLGRLRRATADARRSLDELLARRQRLREQLPQSAEMLASIERTMRQARDSLAVARAQIVEPEGLLAPLDPEVIDGVPRGLRPWRERLAAMAESAQWQDACVGFERWFAVAAETLDAAGAVLTANRRPLAARDELRGRLGALKAKAGGTGLAEEPGLAAAYQAAADALDALPCDLAAARQSVDDYHTAVGARRQRGEPGRAR